MRTGSESGRMQHLHTNTIPAFSLEKAKERKRKEKKKRSTLLSPASLISNQQTVGT